MNTKKISGLQMVVVAVAVLCLAGAGIGAASAEEDTPKTNPMSELVAAIASKFNLNASDIQAVFDEQKTKMVAERKTQMAQMETKRNQEFADRLAKAVAAGKLTQAQADLITAKKAELETTKTSLAGKTGQERRTAIQAQQQALQQWLKDNNIPAGYLPGGQYFGRGMGGGRGHVFGQKGGLPL